MRLLRCYVFSTLLYGMKAWDLKKKDMNSLETFEIWANRIIINWTVEDYLPRSLKKNGKVKIILVKTIKLRMLEYFDYVIRGVNYNSLQIILEGNIFGKTTSGRRRISWIENLENSYKSSTSEFFRSAKSRTEIAIMTTNLLRGG